MTEAYLKSAEGIRGHWSDDIDALFSPWDKTGSPGAIIAVQYQGEVVHQRGYGVANIEDDVPFTADTVLRLGLTSKHLCVTCVLILEHRGQLTLQDDVRKFVPELPDFGSTITIWHLLTMTSGLCDGVNLPLFAGLNTGAAFTRQQLLNIGLSQRQLMFEPGDDCTYSNTNYALLSVIIERISESSIAEFMAQEIFQPLAMNRTALVPWMNRVTMHKARGYNLDEQGEYVAGHMMMELCGDGGIDSTITDMLKWLNNYRDDRHFGPDFRQRLEAESRLNDGRLLKYRLGIEASDYRGADKVNHAGGMPGYLCDFAWFPEQDLGIVLFTNLMDAMMLMLPDKVVDIVLADQLIESAETTFVSASREDIAPLLGVYGNLETGQLIELTQLEDKLVCFMLGELNLMLERDGLLQSAKSLIALDLAAALESNLDGDDSSSRPTLNLILGCQPPIPLTPLDDPRQSPADLPTDAVSFAGLYHDPVTDVRHKVQLQDGQLKVSLAAPMLDLMWQVLTPLGGDMFTAMIDSEPSCTNVIARFLRNAQGRVTQLDYSLNRCRNVIFNKIDGGDSK